LLAVILVIVVAPIGWIGAVSQLFLPTNVASPAQAGGASARRAAAPVEATPRIATPATPTPAAAQAAAATSAAALNAMLLLELAPVMEPGSASAAPPEPTLTRGAQDRVELGDQAAPSPTAPAPTPQATPPEPTSPPASPTPVAFTATPAVVPATGLTYVVQPGDTVWSIAARHGVDPARMLAANRLGPDAAIQIGQALQVPGVDSGIPVIASSESVQASPPTPTAVPPTAIPPTPVPPTATPNGARTSRVPGVSMQGQLQSASSGSSPSPRGAASEASSGVRSASSGSSARLAWPAHGGLSTLFGEEGHAGLDIMGMTGQPVVAAGAGVVLLAAEGQDAYGTRVDVDHGGGLVTVYGHLSALAVKAGDHVTAGQRIGEVGNTGLSTGPHLHFEVRLGGRTVDPLEYLR
jgi:murein DD-endopeptidase MepM/ murein hydrolase activator NlpD